jgi:microcystin-dependent protein
MSFWQWSKTASANGTADPTINFAEGQAGSTLNDASRNAMAALAQWRDDTSGALLSTNTGATYQITSNEAFPTPPPNGQFITFMPNVTNPANALVSLDGGTAFPIQTSPGNAVGAGVMAQGTPYGMTFNATVSAWLLNNFYAAPTSPIVVPLGGFIPYLGTTAPNSSFVLPFGQALSRTTYSALFAMISTTFGVGDGTTTFNIPDLRGRTLHGLDNMGGVAAGRIGTVVTDGGTVSGSTLGSVGGSATHAQTTGEVGSHNHTITDPGHRHTVPILNVVQGSNVLSSFTTGGTTNTSTDPTGITINNSPAASPMSLLTPLMMVGWLLRVL